MQVKKELYQGIRFLLVMFLFVTAICFSSLYSMYNILPWTWTWIRHSFEVRNTANRKTRKP